MDHKDEHFYGKSDSPYHVNTSLINLNHEVDVTMTEKILANPKVLNSKAPQVQANFWGIYDMDAKETVYGKLLHNRREVASVTKIMTAYAVIEVARKYNLNLCTMQIKVDAEGAKVIGTSARLREGDILTAEQLLFGLMLPSGNDAAVVLGKHFGKFLFEKKGYTHVHKVRIKSFEFDNHGSFVKYFLKEMNEQTSQLKMSNTNWDSPHGMGNRQNLTSVADMFKLCEKAMKMPLLVKVMMAKVYSCKSMREDESGNLVQG